MLTRSSFQASMLTFFPEFEEKTHTEVNVLLLVDASNSMKGNEKELKKLVFLAYQELPQGAYFNIVKFGES